MPPPFALLFFVVALPGQASQASAAVPPRLQATRTTEPIVLDGKLDDRAWRTATPSDAFTQHQPDEGVPPTERTEIRVLYDDEALYVGIDCQQVSSPIVRRLQRRDGQLPSDGVWIDIDSRRDGVSAFHFGVNAAGALNDLIHFNDVDASTTWDENWEAKVADTGHGYSVEFRIPLRALRFDTLPVQDWGLQVRRFIDARQEYDDWAFFPRDAGSYTGYFGRLENLVDLRSGRRWQLRPFVLGQARARGSQAGSQASIPTLAHGNDMKVAAGLDAKLQVTRELTLDMAVLPDFGQVEADSVVLNLSTYETFFPEKRPFFLEGADIWAGNAALVYTRRIGRAAPVPTLLAGETLYDVPEPSPIYGAAKLVGTIKGRTTLGILSTVTGRRDVSVQRSDGQRELRLVDPVTAYNVLRVKRLVGARSEIGVYATAVNRIEPTPLTAGALCPTTAAIGEGRCFNDAYVASADGRWRSPSGNYAGSAQGFASLLSGGPARAQRDGLAIQPGHASGGAIAWIGKEGGERWLWSVWQAITGKRLELNDLGYLDRKNDYALVAELTYRTVAPWWRTLERRKTLRLRYRDTLDGIPLSRGVELSVSWLFRNYWRLAIDARYFGNVFDDRETQDGTALERGGRRGGTLSINSDPRRRVVLSSYASADSVTGGYRFETGGQITFRVLPQLELDVSPALALAAGEPRFVFADSSPGTTDYVFGRQRARSAGVTLRASYTFTPELSLQTYGQLFLAAVHYSDFSRAASPGFRGRIHLADLTPTTTTSNPDLQSATLNVNVVLRWEFHLGSTLFLVYTRAQSPPVTLTSGADPRLDPGSLARRGSSIDVVLLKLAYWWG